MRKRFLVVMLVVSFGFGINSGLFAEFGTLAKGTSVFDVFGYMNTYHHVSVFPMLIEQSRMDQLDYGMPFNLRGEDVQYTTTYVLNTTDSSGDGSTSTDDSSTTDNTKGYDIIAFDIGGRQIATWSLYSNYKSIHLKMKVDNLKLQGSTSDSDEIPFYLFFTYYSPSENSVTTKPEKGVIVVRSGMTDYVDIVLGEGLAFRSTDMPVRFKLTKDASDSLADKTPGLYTATVTLLLEAI